MSREMRVRQWNDNLAVKYRTACFHFLCEWFWVIYLHLSMKRCDTTQHLVVIMPKRPKQSQFFSNFLSNLLCACAELQLCGLGNVFVVDLWTPRGFYFLLYTQWGTWGSLKISSLKDDWGRVTRKKENDTSQPSFTHCYKAPAQAWCCFSIMNSYMSISAVCVWLFWHEAQTLLMKARSAANTCRCAASDRPTLRKVR